MAKLTKSFPHIWFLATGGSLDFIVGATKRAPLWMQNVGLEWLHRLLHEPRRLFTRYIVHDLPFAFRLLATAAIARRRPTRNIADTKAANSTL
jgi:N-acetylglucosaminyldiphosphoundecaprenol N-acetyl-beta-D-mannosaminyltransferase